MVVKIFVERVMDNTPPIWIIGEITGEKNFPEELWKKREFKQEFLFKTIEILLNKTDEDLHLIRR